MPIAEHHAPRRRPKNPLLYVKLHIRPNCGRPSSSCERWLSALPLTFIYSAQELSKTYRAQPLRRIYIDKEDGRKRPISIPALEDKIVQRATVELLNAIFEQDFLGLLRIPPGTNYTRRAG